jgi:hypothetical protein
MTEPEPRHIPTSGPDDDRMPPRPEGAPRPSKWRTASLSGRLRVLAVGLFLTLLAVALLLAFLGSNSPSQSDPAASGGETTPIRFSPRSFWHRPLPRGQALDDNSPALVAELQRQVNEYSATINIHRYSVPIYEVPRDQPRVRVRNTRSYDAGLNAAWAAVPIPPGARTAAGDDKHMVIWQPSTDTMWEFWNMDRTAGGWQAEWGGRMTHVSRNPGWYPTFPGWGATASGLPLAAGVITVSELRAGRIEHPLAIAIPESLHNAWSLPAQRTDGYSSTPGITPIPEGARFRLDPRLDLRKLKLPRITRMMAEAAQKYGIILRDKAGAVVFYMEDPVTMPVDPYPTLLRGARLDQIARAFPWRYLQALPLRIRNWG